MATPRDMKRGKEYSLRSVEYILVSSPASYPDMEMRIGECLSYPPQKNICRTKGKEKSFSLPVVPVVYLL
jgi:hypothetical protein